jgi:hypothetical protein
VHRNALKKGPLIKFCPGPLKTQDRPWAWSVGQLAVVEEVPASTGVGCVPAAELTTPGVSSMLAAELSNAGFSCMQATELNTSGTGAGTGGRGATSRGVLQQEANVNARQRNKSNKQPTKKKRLNRREEN